MKTHTLILMLCAFAAVYTRSQNIVKVSEGAIDLLTYFLDRLELTPFFERDWSYQREKRDVYPYPLNDNMTRCKETVTWNYTYNSVANYQLAQMHSSEKRYDVALGYLAASIDYNGRSWSTLRLKASIYRTTFDYPENHQVFLVDECSPHDSQIYWYMAQVYKKTGLNDFYRKCCNKATQVDIKRGDFRYWQRLALKVLGREKEAEALLEETLVEDEKSDIETQYVNYYGAEGIVKALTPKPITLRISAMADLTET